MREADEITLLRTVLVFPIAYMILSKFQPAWITIVLMVVMFVMDALDGYAAVKEKSRGEVTMLEYAMAALGDMVARHKVSGYKAKKGKGDSYGPRLDIAGDRVTEYILWIVFVAVNIVPLFVLMLIVVRHSFADALMGARGTSSKMKSRFARLVYSSNIGRGGVAVVKVVTFSYLTLVYTSGWNLTVGYALTAVLAAYILIRGAAEIYESLQ